jgi:high-affinity nickel-transport protein
MTMIDSLDSVLMLFSYVAFAERSFNLFEVRQTSAADRADHALPALSVESPANKGAEEINAEMQVALRVKQNAMSGLSIILTAMSILVAFWRVSKL